MTKKSNIIILIGVGLAGIGAYFGYKYFQTKKQISPTNPQQSNLPKVIIETVVLTSNLTAIEKISNNTNTQINGVTAYLNAIGVTPTNSEQSLLIQQEVINLAPNETITITWDLSHFSSLFDALMFKGFKLIFIVDDPMLNLISNTLTLTDQ